ncbi:putative Pre-rRNA-processing protein TSR2 [Melia azedarach]|uniref:Pre-rRNA-processing protein TSR2 n=2 Tax=Melia azedarach TaxID=155640 RepID=A0ACC1YDM0_MELAZ|nr:putative Pre-rRNA-processing protein TSR2 [Melia azedarach]KAJ4721583.1 putative Pre-rRNA-processing protein TSR2 [Melia azedarach]
MSNVNASIGGGGAPPQLPPELAPIFREGIALTLAQWSALQMAIENEWGGRGSRAIAEQLVSDIFSWFTQSKEMLYIDDLENILDEAMLSLNTMTEDGSVEEVAEKLMIMHEECLEGNYQSIVKLRETHPPAVARSHVRQTMNNDEDDDSSDDDENDASNMMVDTSGSNSNSNPANIQTRGAAATAEDGWTVVSSKQKGKRNP